MSNFRKSGVINGTGLLAKVGESMIARNGGRGSSKTPLKRERKPIVTRGFHKPSNNKYKTPRQGNQECLRRRLNSIKIQIKRQNNPYWGMTLVQVRQAIINEG